MYHFIFLILIQYNYRIRVFTSGIKHNRITITNVLVKANSVYKIKLTQNNVKIIHLIFGNTVIAQHVVHESSRLLSQNMSCYRPGHLDSAAESECDIDP